MEVDDQPTGISAPIDEETSDWEYEYDETETESFYVTIDCSSNSHQTRAPNKPKIPSKEPNPNPGEQDQQSQQDEQLNGDEQDEHDQATNEEDLPIDPALLNEAPERDGSPSSNLPNTQANTPAPTPSDPLTRVQILDLHTPNPLISYNSQLYSCTWASTIGTDVFLVSPSSLSSLPNTTPLQTFPNVSILSTSCIKLTARPITITPKPEPSQHPPGSEPAANDPLKIPLAPTAKTQQRNQASFLEKLIAIKAAKGEKDEVTVFSRVANQGTGWRARRKQDEARALLAVDNGPGGDDGADHENAGPTDPIPRNEDTVPHSPNLQQPTSSHTSPSPAKRARGPGGGRPRGRGRGRIGRPRGSRGARSRGLVGLFRDDMPRAS
ncbi:MAG: hypothetical protein Q9218_008158, partial [Villophora microphyllina]